jgi:CRP/FNR family transcriptional regulator
MLGYPPGVRLFIQGHPSTDVFYLERGLVKLTSTQPSGEAAIIALRAAGWFLGAAAALLEQRHCVTAVTMVPCSLSRLPASLFRRLLRLDAELSWRVHEAHAEEICAQLTETVERVCLPAKKRLERFLGQLAIAATADREQPARRIVLPLKRWEIAPLISVSPQYLSGLFRELEATWL